MTDDMNGNRKVELKRAPNGIYGSIFVRPSPSDEWDEVALDHWSDDDLVNNDGPVTFDDAVEIESTADGISVSVYAHLEDQSHLLNETWWTDAEFNLADPGEILFTHTYERNGSIADRLADQA